jgi:hypothetical protein
VSEFQSGNVLVCGSYLSLVAGAVLVALVIFAVSVVPLPAPAPLPILIAVVVLILPAVLLLVPVPLPPLIPVIAVAASPLVAIALPLPLALMPLVPIVFFGARRAGKRSGACGANQKQSQNRYETSCFHCLSIAQAAQRRNRGAKAHKRERGGVSELHG